MRRPDSQIGVHSKLLFDIDYKLLRDAQRPEVRARLTEARGEVAMHLTEAKIIRVALAGAAQ